MSDVASEKEKGNAAFREGDYAKALSHYDNAIKNAGNTAGAALFSNKAAALHQLKNYDACIQQCLKGLAAPGLTPELKSKIYLRMGAAYESQEMFREAMDAFEKCDRGTKLQKMTDLVAKIARNKIGGVDFWVQMCNNLLHQTDYVGGDMTALTSLMEYLTLEKSGAGLKPSRSELIADHNQFVCLCKQISSSGVKLPRFNNNDEHDGGLGHKCTASFFDLKPITIGQLLSDEINVDKTLICRIITEPVVLSSVITLVEDPAGEVIRLSMRGAGSRSDETVSELNSVFAIGTYLAIKEPLCLTAGADGQPILLVNNPGNDILCLSQEDLNVKWKVNWRTAAPACYPDSWESFEKRGNELFVAGKYKLAIHAYDDAIELKRKVAPSKLADLFVKRAAAYMSDERPMDAFWDCQSALFVEPGHLKATFRLAKANACLGKYEEAKDVLEKSSHTTRPQFQAQIWRLNRLIREQQHGDYDLKSMLKEAAASKTPHLDHADYNGGVEVAWVSEEKGNGLVALRDFAPGDLLFVSKAFEATYNSECESGASVDPEDLLLNPPARAECLSRIIPRIAFRNNDHIKKFYRLYAGKDFKRFDFDVLDGEGAAPTFDRSRVDAIVTLNAIGFSGALQRDGGVPSFDAVNSGITFGGSGIWMLASFMNHSCVPNTASLFVGDVMFLRARKAIRKGEELTRCYVVNGISYKLRAFILDQVYGFHCECELCVCDLKRSADKPLLETQRKAFMDAFDATTSLWITDAKELAKVVEFNRKMADDFSNRLAYKDRYDQDLRRIYIPLGIGYSFQQRWLEAAKVFEMAYATTVGNGTQPDAAFVGNPLTTDEFYCCCYIASNYLLGLDFAKAKEYFGKMQQAAKICWGSADMELLQMLYPKVPIRKFFESFV